MHVVSFTYSSGLSANSLRILTLFLEFKHILLDIYSGLLFGFVYDFIFAVPRNSIYKSISPRNS